MKNKIKKSLDKEIKSEKENTMIDGVPKKQNLNIQKKYTRKKKIKPNFVVAVGASAGGLEALEEFFRAIPEVNDVAFVVIQHLSPDFKSMMDELLARHTKMKIQRARTGVSLEAGSIYLMIPRQNLIVENGKLKLLKPDLSRGLNLPIDIMFDSLAEDQQGKAIAIILSGAGRDGSRGIENIKDRKGYIMAQDETTAKFDSMPRSAAQTGLVDFIGSPLELGEHVLRLTQHPDAKPISEKPILAPNSTKMEEIINILRTSTDFDFTHYKPATIGRRIERRMGILQIPSLDGYIDHLIQYDKERQELARDMLIGVTRFFRDPEMWIELQQRVLRPMLENLRQGNEFRGWVAACSTGEEAYTLAICLKELMEEMNLFLSVKIFASDIDPGAITTAASGVYPAQIASEVSADLLQKYFVRKDEKYEIIRPIREMIIFARHNLITDAPFTRLDIATCRNMLIYLEIPAQKQALANLHFGLKDDGRMFIGPSESLGDMKEVFVADIESIKCFTKISHGKEIIRDSSLVPSVGSRLRQPSRHAQQNRPYLKTDSTLFQALEYIAGKYSFPGMLVSADGHLIYSFGNLKEVAEMPSGGFSSDVARLVRKEISAPLSAALRRCSTVFEPIVYKDIGRSDGDKKESIHLRVEPIVNSHTKESNFLILFEKAELPKNSDGQVVNLVSNNDVNEDIQNLERELKLTKETLQSTIEELETSNEELQSSNEELIASNEELQSTNEELHSVNEELQTVNTEYHAKIQELTSVTEDFENLLRSTNIGTIFLDEDLRIRKFTKSVTDVIDLVEHDVGRRIDQFRTQLSDIGFIDNIKRVLKSGKSYIQEVLISSGSAYILRIMPFQSVSRTDSGVVITFVDITSLERASAALALMERKYRQLFENYPDATAALDNEGKLISVNSAWTRVFGYGATDILGIHVNSLFKTKDTGKTNQISADLWAKLQADKELNGTEVFGVKKSGGDFPAGISYNFDRENENNFIIIEDLSEKHESTLALKNAISNLKKSNVELEQFGSIVAHDLKEPLRMVRGFSKLLKNDCMDTIDSEGVDYIENIDAGTSRMQSMIDDLLNFATITSENGNFTKVDFNKIITETKRVLKTKIEATGTRLTVGKLPTLVAMPGQMLHVFQNLIENGIKYRGEDTPNIAIEALRIDDVWRFSVQDNGIGIKNQHSEKIFEVFKRLHSRNKYEGTGIGLALVKKIIHNHDGTIWVESEFGVGSTFFFTLKAAE